MKLWISASTIVGLLDLIVAYVFCLYFDFSDDGDLQMLFGVGGTMLAIIAAVAIFVHQAVGERGSYWGGRIAELDQALIDASEPSEAFEQMTLADGPITAGKDLLTDLIRVASAVGLASMLLLMSLVAGALGIFGSAFVIDLGSRKVTHTQLFGSIELASILLGALIITAFVISTTRAGLIRNLKRTLDQMSPDETRNDAEKDLTRRAGETDTPDNGPNPTPNV